MAAALRSVSRKISSGALQRALQQPRFSAGASAAVKEGQRMLLPRISRHGGTSLRRFSSNEAQAPNLLNSNKTPQHLPCDEAKSGLSEQIKETKHKLLDLLRQMEGEYSLGNEHKELQHLLQRSTSRELRELATIFGRVGAGAILAGAVTATAVYNFVFPVGR